MADIKTTFRELSVIYGIVKFFNGGIPKDFGDFTETVKKYTNSSSMFLSFQNVPEQIESHKRIIENGIEIAKAIVTVLDLKELPIVTWVGESTQSGTPADITVNGVAISLKEESYILENMGLYRLVNILTGTDYSRGDLHIFKKFAPNEYSEWFRVTWLLLLNQLNKERKIVVSDKDRGYISEISKLDDGGIEMKYSSSERNSSTILSPDLNLADFEKNTSSLLREKVFAKWINLHASSNPDYLKAKHACSDVAGKNLTKLVGGGKGTINLARLFRIADAGYYYAKAFNGKVEMFAVPSLEEFIENFEVKSLEYAVPRSQLNFYTQLVNTETKKDFTLRNEIRFSHGQFNGTPEAKLYVERGSLLDVIYEKVFSS